MSRVVGQGARTLRAGRRGHCLLDMRLGGAAGEAALAALAAGLFGGRGACAAAKGGDLALADALGRRQVLAQGGVFLLQGGDLRGQVRDLRFRGRNVAVTGIFTWRQGSRHSRTIVPNHSRGAQVVVRRGLHARHVP
jgi:hypothetical protein